MNIAFHSNQLGVRGTETSLYDYALYNDEILGNRSIIISDKNSNLSALKKFEDRFKVLLYDNFDEVENFVDEYRIDSVYYIKAGFNDGKTVRNAKNLIHSVFQHLEPHGDRYAYVSRWLSDKMSNGIAPYVPHMVDIMRYDHDKDFRDSLGISKGDLVFGYYGGSRSFNIEFARRAVVEIAANNKDMHFLFMNSQKFCDLENVIFMEPTSNLEQKISFINTCDACIHARNEGESFGLSIAEFSSKNKPIITTTYSELMSPDLAHIEMLGEKAILYDDYDSLTKILSRFDDYRGKTLDWNAYREYSPNNVMQIFKNVFIDT